MRRTIPLLLAATLAAPLFAQGLHAPGPRGPGPQANLAGLRLSQLSVQARIADGVATTELRQVFRNDTNRVREAIWILPLPDGATADGFTMTVNGEKMESEVLDAGGARRIYEGIVRRQRDPGLLEYAGRGCLRARIFPIPPHGEVKAEVRFRQVLPQTAGLYEWSFPLRAAKVGARGAEQINLDVEIVSQTPIRNVFTPLPGVDIVREGDKRARVSMELAGGQMPSRDLQVFFGLENKEFGLNLLSYRKGEKPGYFFMALSPKQDWPVAKNTHRAIQFVVDTSGSMKGKKIEQAKNALRFFVKSLKPGDYFNIVPFSTEARPLFDGVDSASAENVAKALAAIDEIDARGGTNIEDAMRTALTAQMPEIDSKEPISLVPMVVFLTDGKPTVGDASEDGLVKLTGTDNRHKQRVFVFGVGYDLNARLLDRIAETTRGTRDYVVEDEDIEVKTGALFDRLSNPVMTDLKLLCDDMDGFAVHPKQLPDLFKGDQLMILGRYRKAGHHAIRLEGMVDGQKRTYVYEGDFVAADKKHDFVPPLWGERRVAVLLDALRLNGAQKELIDEITQLGREFGIVTPYTSHLILEDADRQRLLANGRRDRGAPPPGGPAGPATGGPVGAADPQAGPTGPATPGAAGPSTPGSWGARGGGGAYRGPGDVQPPTVQTASDDFFMGAGRNGQRSKKEREVVLQRTLVELQRAGALPADAGVEQLQVMFARIGGELWGAETRLGRLGEQADGKAAVDNSLYLMGMMNRAQGLGGGDKAGSLAALLTHRIGERTFRLRAGVWTDSAFKPEMKDQVVKVVAFSDAYFKLLADNKELAPVLAFSTRMLVVVDGKAYEIVEPEAEKPKDEKASKPADAPVKNGK